MRLRHHIGPKDLVTVYDATSARAQINIHGPKARALMQKVTCADMTSAAFLFLAAKCRNAIRTTLLRIPACLPNT